jgi:putative chitinase
MTANELETVLRGVGVTAIRARNWAPRLVEAFAKAELTTPLRVGHFLAQILHESANLVYSEEIWGPTPAQRRYEGRRDLGNTQRGDGHRFRGRGPIQLTGRSNYARFTAWLNENGFKTNVVTHPDLVASPQFGALAAVWFWTRNNLNQKADAGDRVADVRAVTRVVNGGYNGVDDRIRKFSAAMLHIRKIASFRGDKLPFHVC